MEIGRLGPAKRNPFPEAAALEIVKVYLLELVIEMGLIRLLPTSTVPKLAADTATTFSAAAGIEIVNRERSRRLPDTSLRGDPRPPMLFTLCGTCL